MSQNESQRAKRINVESVLASKDLAPLVMLRLGDEYTNMPVEQARKVGLWLIEAAEAAEQDAVFLGFYMSDTGTSLHRAASALKRLRNHRKAAAQSEDEAVQG